ncbi:MAG: flagellar biosynthesis protein FlhB [Sneathiella sp.]|jgi:flagellar biosynthetic protein FlhB|uniref:flagellar biosynthesis protein FlhB n=1 Tax=Sneathiella sp. TaxID=1964365 RepID=UPI000C6A1174|nr:flagellar biosynthesis protein FlhB [Sneathiella sp.]MAL80715.1 flagellar biosynthesis protein FlhB [Sneathiella sp.]
MAEDTDDAQKTEEPTAKRLEDAFKKGQVPKSQEVGHWFMTMGIGLVVLIFIAGLGKGLAFDLLKFIEQPHAIATDRFHLGVIFGDLGWAVIWVVAPALGTLMLAGLIGNLIQHRPILSAERIKPKLEKISIFKGFKRLFSSKSLVEFAKGLLKLTIVGSVAVLFVLPSMNELPVVVSYDVPEVLKLIQEQSLLLIAGIVAVMSVIAGLDFLYQRFNHYKELRMTKQEIKDEFKQTEGDPMVRARLRALRAERSRQRMMQAVPEADVVITNPTHFAVALQYKPEEERAPVVVAKGMDNIAAKIREIATENEIPIVENPPLARALHKACDLDEEIPYEHFKAVAEIISYVMRLNKSRLKN